MLADEDRLEVRRQTNEQDKHLDVISDALSDLQRIGEVGIQTGLLLLQHKNVISTTMQNAIQLVLYATWYQLMYEMHSWWCWYCTCLWHSACWLLCRLWAVRSNIKMPSLSGTRIT